MLHAVLYKEKESQVYTPALTVHCLASALQTLYIITVRYPLLLFDHKLTLRLRV